MKSFPLIIARKGNSIKHVPISSNSAFWNVGTIDDSLFVLRKSVIEELGGFDGASFSVGFISKDKTDGFPERKIELETVSAQSVLTIINELSALAA